jgi:hypothetical protein
VEYYKVVVASSSNDSGRFLLSKRIEETEEELSLLMMNNRRLEPFTCEGTAAYAKSLFLTERTTVWAHDRKPYDWSKASLTQVNDWYLSAKLSEHEIRAIARSREWRQIWNVKACGQLFGQSLFLLSDQSTFSPYVLIKSVSVTDSISLAGTFRTHEQIDLTLFTSARTSRDSSSTISLCI